MRRLILVKTLVTVIVLGATISGLFISCLAERAAAAHITVPGSQASSHKGASNNGSHVSGASSPRCSRPGPGEAQRCRELEQQILASTVRLEWDVWTINNKTRSGPLDGSIGYATIKAGRYLVTHNHLGFLLTQPGEGTYITVSVFDAGGHPIWMAAPLSTIAIVAQEAETLVLDFGSYGGDGLFAKLGLGSAKFTTWEALHLQPGMEVAQIDWDGAQAHVEWATIDDIITSGGTPRLALANSVEAGASGGGVFWNAYHVANTWYREIDYGRGGISLRKISVAALNSAEVVALRR